jgi:hypothetical protein
MLAQRVLEERDVHQAVARRYADTLAKGADGLGGEAAPPHTRQGRHARVVPGSYVPPFHELLQLALAQHRVGEVEARKFDLRGVAGERESVEVPVIERPVIHELERAYRMRDPFDGVRLTVRPVVHRIDAPGVAGAVVVRARSDT